MSKWRKKPVTIDAWEVAHLVTAQWDTGVLPDPIDIAKSKGTLRFHDECIVVRTLEGNMRAEHGDWLIRGVQGEFYPCKPDVFAATYERVSW